MQSEHKFWKTLLSLNIAHIIIGILSLILALVQFSPATLDNASLIDFRLLNIVHTVTGSVGLHMILKNFGSVVPKSLYCLSFALSLWTLAFYADSLAQESTQFESMREIRRLDGGQELVTDEMFRSHVGKIAVCTLMVLLSLVELAISGACFLIMERLNSENSSSKSLIKPVVSSSNRRRKQQMAFVALMKIACGLATVCLGSYLEALYKKKTAFMKMGWHILTGSIIFFGACVDLRALYGGKGWNILNLKVSLIFSVASAVFSLKTLDYAMSNYFVADLREYSRYDELKLELETALNGIQVNPEGDKREAFVKFVVHAAVIGALALSFAHSVISAVEAGSFLEKSNANKQKPPSTKTSTLENSRIFGTVPASNFRYHRSPDTRMNDGSESDELNVFLEYDDNLHKRKTCAGIFQCVCGLALIALCVISLVSWDFSRGYDGGAGVLWLGCLFVASGLINANRPKTFTTSVYALSVISSVLSFERAMYSFNVIYQAASNPRFKSELDSLPNDPAGTRSNYNAHTGRIVLYCIESSVLLIEFLASTYTCLKFTQAIREMPRSIFTKSKGAVAKSKGALCSLGFFHLVYAFVTIAVSIAAEVALWAYNVHVPFLVYSTNGVVVFAAVFVQWLSSQHCQFLTASAVMNAVTASISFFVMAPATRDLYNLVASYRSVYEGGHQQMAANEILDAELKAKPIQEWIIGMNALIVLLSITEYVVSVISGMISSYLLHHTYEARNGSGSDLRFPTLTTRVPLQWSNGGHRRSSSVSSSLAAGIDLYANQTKPFGMISKELANGIDEYKIYSQQPMRSLNRVNYPANGVQNANLNSGNYGSLSNQQYIPRVSTRNRNYEIPSGEEYGESRYAYSYY